MCLRIHRQKMKNTKRTNISDLIYFNSGCRIHAFIEMSIQLLPVPTTVEGNAESISYITLYCRNRTAMMNSGSYRRILCFAIPWN